MLVFTEKKIRVVTFRANLVHCVLTSIILGGGGGKGSGFEDICNLYLTLKITV